MWTPTARAQHRRAGLRHGSDGTDAEWLIPYPFLPAPRSCGCPRKWGMREIVNALFYVLYGGIAWSLLPKEFPPASTTYRWFARFRDDGVWEATNHHLVRLDRERSSPERHAPVDTDGRALGGRTELCLDQQKQAAGKEFRGHNR